jgi:hypothetical protein
LTIGRRNVELIGDAHWCIELRRLELSLLEVRADRPLLPPKDWAMSELDLVRLLRLDPWLLNRSHMLLQHGLLLRFLQLLLFQPFFFYFPKREFS